MRVLGIESSCDETGLAVYDSEEGLLGEVLHSQIPVHQDYGGVVPELASRDHIRFITPLLQKLLKETHLSLKEIDLIAYTAGPGLSGALLVGAAFAESLAFSLNLPVFPIHHLEGHLLSSLLKENAPAFPFLALLVSGGHTQLLKVEGVGNYHLLGETLDDAAGEAFDKTASLLGLPYPGGAKLAQLAQKGIRGKIKLPSPMLHSKDLDFSFSGLKTAVRQKIEKNLNLTPQFCADIARAFEDSVVEVLTEKTLHALKTHGLNEVVVAGGVSANQHLRKVFNEKAKRFHFKTHYPSLNLCTDNGAMIAFAAFLRIKAGFSPKTAGGFAVFPRIPLKTGDFPR